MTKYGSWDGLWVVPGIALPAHPQVPLPRVHPSPTEHAAVLMAAVPRGQHPENNMVVGLISVDQLSLGTQISGSQGITESYNLVGIGRIINHLDIPGTK